VFTYKGKFVSVLH